jgi:glucosamine kinase
LFLYGGNAIPYQTGYSAVNQNLLLLGVDGGGTRCRARLSTLSGKILGEAVVGPANLRLGLEQSFSTVFEVAARCLDLAALSRENLARIVACLALAGASEPALLAAAQQQNHPFGKVMITTDAHAACIGAHGGRDGGIIIAGTGTVGWGMVNGQTYRVGGWGLPISDEGSGAWLGGEALRRTLWAWDGRIAWTPVLRALFAGFENDAHAIVRWTATASPRDFGSLTPCIVDHASRGDTVAIELMKLAAAHIDALAARLVTIGISRLALVGGLAPSLQPWLARTTISHLIEPAGDALAGALSVARSAAKSIPQTH